MPVTKVLTSGPWESVYNSSDSSEAYRTTLYAASNVYKPKGGSSFEMRPPFFVTKAAGTLGVPGSRFGDTMIEHTALNGTRYRFVFVGGKVYRWDGSATYTDVTPASPVIASAQPRVYACSFADNLIVSDGIHRPWYVPASGMGATPLVATQIDLDGLGTIWSSTGAPVVYDARLFFVISTIGGAGGFQDTIVWSEVDNPTTGYQQSAAGFANFWELAQTDGHPIYALAATEISLVVFRAKSILNITGKTDQAFVTNATRESVEGIGTTSPNAVVVHNGVVWFLDEVGRQYRYQPGGTPEPLWTQMADTATASIPTLQIPQQNATASYHPDLNLIISGSFGAPIALGAVLGVTLLHVFDAVSGKYQGTWDVDGLKTIHSIACIRIGLSPVLCVLGESISPVNSGWTLATSGQMWRQRAFSEMSGVSWSDPSGVPTVSVTTHHLGRNEEGEWIFDQLALRGVTSSANAAGRTIPLTYYTPRGSTTPPAAVLSQPPSRPIANGLTGFEGEARAVWGLGPNAQGRWLMATASAPTAAQTAQPFTPTAIELRGIITRATPQAP